MIHPRSRTADLLRIFFSVAHDPTELNRQGPDEGTQYRSVIFYANEDQKQIALAYIDQLNNAKVFRKPIVTQVVPLQAFYPAEAYHQNFLALHPDNPYIVINDLPKLRKLQKQFPTLLDHSDGANDGPSPPVGTARRGFCRQPIARVP